MIQLLNNLLSMWEINRKEQQKVLWPDLEKKLKVMRLPALHHSQANTTPERRNSSTPVSKSRKIVGSGSPL